MNIDYSDFQPKRKRRKRKGDLTPALPGMTPKFVDPNWKPKKKTPPSLAVSLPLALPYYPIPVATINEEAEALFSEEKHAPSNGYSIGKNYTVSESKFRNDEGKVFWKYNLYDGGEEVGYGYSYADLARFAKARGLTREPEWERFTYARASNGNPKSTLNVRALNTRLAEEEREREDAERTKEEAQRLKEEEKQRKEEEGREEALRKRYRRLVKQKKVASSVISEDDFVQSGGEYDPEKTYYYSFLGFHGATSSKAWAFLSGKLTAIINGAAKLVVDSIKDLGSLFKREQTNRAYNFQSWETAGFDAVKDITGFDFEAFAKRQFGEFGVVSDLQGNENLARAAMIGNGLLQSITTYSQEGGENILPLLDNYFSAYDPSRSPYIRGYYYRMGAGEVAEAQEYFKRIYGRYATSYDDFRRGSGVSDEINLGLTINATGEAMDSIQRKIATYKTKAETSLGNLAKTTQPEQFIQTSQDLLGNSIVSREMKQTFVPYFSEFLKRSSQDYIIRHSNLLDNIRRTDIDDTKRALKANEESIKNLTRALKEGVSFKGEFTVATGASETQTFTINLN